MIVRPSVLKFQLENGLTGFGDIRCGHYAIMDHLKLALSASTWEMGMMLVALTVES